MEQLLFLLFVLFSVGSALLERRRRKLARRRAEEAEKRGEQVGGPVEEEEPHWPFPTADPFELEPPPDRLTEQELDRQALEAIQRGREAEERARALERQAQEAPPRRRVEELVREALKQNQLDSRRPKKGWALSAEDARRGIIYAEILGKPKADRREEL